MNHLGFLYRAFGVICFLAFSGQAHAQMRSCQLAQNAPDYSFAQHCLGFTEDQAFNECQIRSKAAQIHDQIQQNLEYECRVEQEVQRIQFERDRIQAQGGQEPLPSIPQEYNQVLARIYGHPMTRGVPDRTDSCLANRLMSELTTMTRERCDPNPIREVCTPAAQAANAALEASQNRTRDAMQHRTPSGAMEFAYEQQKAIGTALKTLQDANIACERAIVRIAPCVDLFNTYFNQQENQNLAQHCTHEGLKENVDRYVSFMNGRVGPPTLLRRLSTDHIVQRRKEDTVARELENLTNFIAEMESRNPEVSRDLASEAGEN